MTDASAAAQSRLVADGLELREARWLVEEFGADVSPGSSLRAAADRRRRGEPLQYVLGHWPFRDLDLLVDERVLVPRPETESLVTIALEELAHATVRAPLVLDLGTGSGAIGLSIVSELSDRGVASTLVAVDESADALDLARTNALRTGVLAVSFVRSTWYAALDASLAGRVDLIVANPPYVGVDEFLTLDPVLRHEPYGALVSPDRDGVVGFDDLASIVTEAPRWLRPGGVVVCEHGDRHGEPTRRAAAGVGLVDARTEHDLAGRPRFLVARRAP